MNLAGMLLDPGFRSAASVAVAVGRAGADLGDLAALVASIDIEAGRNEAATGSITFDDRRREDGNWMVADSGLFRRWEAIKVSADFKTHVEEIFRGYVAALKPQAPQNAGEAKLVVELQDDGMALNREHMRRVWGADAPMTDRAILEELIAPLNLRVASGSANGRQARALSMDTTPIQFLRERARANGYELIFARGEVFFGPMQLGSQVQATIMVYAGSATNCLSFAVTDDAQRPDAVAFETAPRGEGAAPVTAVVRPDQPVLGTTPVAEEGAGTGTPSVHRIAREGDEDEDEIRARAQALANDASFRIRAVGELDGTLYGHVLLPGRLVRVDGVGSRNSGLYYVDKVTHQFRPDGYRQGFELIRNATGESDGPGAPLSAALSAIAGLF